MMDPLLNAQIDTILVVNFGGIGDEILFFPVIQSLKEAYPKARLTALVEPRCEGIMRFNPAIDHVEVFDAKNRPSVIAFAALVLRLRRQRFDLTITAGSSPVMAILARLTGARYRVGYATHRLTGLLTHKVPLNKQQYAGAMYHDLVGFLGKAPRLPQMSIPARDREWAQSFLQAHGVAPSDRVVLFHPGVSQLSIRKNIIKGWDPLRWGALGRRLTDQGLRVVLAGGPDDADVMAQLRANGGFPFIDAYGQTQGLGQLAALMNAVRLIVAVDSAPMHVGVAVGTPVVAVFGPTDPRKLLPAGTAHVAVYDETLACRPCLWDHRKTSCEALSCLKNIDVERVERAVFKLLPGKAIEGA
jgi:ADP-heptose:LPS heptosyltransferase